MKNKLVDILRKKLITLTALLQCSNYIYQCHLSFVKNNDEDTKKQFDQLTELVNDEFNLKDSNKCENFIISHLFIGVISEIEGALEDIQRIVLRKYPYKIKDISFKLNVILENDSINDLVEIAINKMLVSSMYQKPNDYKKGLFEIISAPDDFMSDNWQKYVEMKARRDIGVHNNWIRNDTYLSKIQEVGIIDDGVLFKGIDSEYFKQSVIVAIQMIKEIIEHCESKFK